MVFQPILAGPICSGFSCLPFVVLFFSFTVVPIAAVIFGLWLLVYWGVFHRRPPKKWIIIMIITSLIIGYIGYTSYSTNKANNKYEVKQRKAAANLDFTLYKPSYIVPKFELVETVADDVYNKTLIFLYFDKSTQQSRNSTATKNYTVTIKSSSSRYGEYSLDNKIIASKTLNDTKITVQGTISESEAEKVLNSLKQVEYTGIEFQSDWAGYR